MNQELKDIIISTALNVVTDNYPTRFSDEGMSPEPLAVIDEMEQAVLHEDNGEIIWGLDVLTRDHGVFYVQVAVDTHGHFRGQIAARDRTRLKKFYPKPLPWEPKPPTLNTERPMETNDGSQ